MKSQPLWLALLCSALIQPLQAAPLSPDAQTDPVHQAGDGVIRLYGPGGPDTAIAWITLVPGSTTTNSSPP